MKTEVNIKDAEALRLLMQYRKGDDTAFTALYNMYAEKMMHYGMKITPDTELIKDSIQDIFIKLLDKNSKRNITHVGNYLFISLRNKLLDYFRRANYMSESDIADMQIKESIESVEKAYIVMEHEEICHRKVNHLMQNLTSRQKQAFQLYYLEQKEYNDICEIMDMNYHSIRNLVHRGMLRLREAAI